MADEELKRLAACLGEASELVFNLVSTSKTTRSIGNNQRQGDFRVEQEDKHQRSPNLELLGQRQSRLSAPTSSTSHVRHQRPRATATDSSAPGRSTTFANLGRVVSRAQGMMQQASSSGLYRRLSQSERLRATTSSSSPQFRSSSRGLPAKKPKVDESRPFEFVLVSFGEEDEGKNLKDGNVLLRGFVTLSTSDCEQVIKDKIAKAINTRFPIINGKDLIFLKANRRKLENIVTADNFDYKQVKLLAGQGAIYLKLKDSYEFMLEQTSLSDEDDDDFASKIDDHEEIPQMPCSDQTTNVANKDNLQIPVPQSPESRYEELLQADIIKCIAFCRENQIVEPVEVLRQVQKYIVQGRPLDAIADDTTLEGETNYILVNRQDVLGSMKEELKTISNPRLTLEVSFFGESAEDYGGPRREFFQLSLNAVKAKYFDSGWRSHVAADYEVVGLVLALSVLQNGLMPRFIPVELLEDVFNSDTNNPCVKSLQKGMDKVGLCQFVKEFPSLHFLFQDSSAYVLSFKRLACLLEPTFSEEGSNSRSFESSVYSTFIKYAREVASGKREGLNLESILQFATCSREEPPLGFAMKPSIHFCEAQSEVKWSFVPSGNTCINRLHLPRPTKDIPLPPEDDLFEVYDHAFMNTYFGRN